MGDKYFSLLIVSGAKNSDCYSYGLYMYVYEMWLANDIMNVIIFL